MEFATMMELLLSGLAFTLQIFVTTLIGSLPLGVLVAFGRMSRFKPVALVTRFYISVMRGTPLMLQLMALMFGPYYLFGLQMGNDWKYWACSIGFIINYAAYFGEIYRGGIQSIPRGQYEAAEVLGYSRFQTFMKIVLPQVVKRILPAMSNEIITLVKDISLKVQPGEVVAVIGPSGGGKSTLLRCMTLLETLDAGRLAYGDLVVAESDGAGAAAYAPKAVLKEAKTRFGLVFQNFNLFPHYSVLKNITDAPLHVQKRPKDEVLAAARGLLAKMGLAGKEDMVPCELSGGQQQRVAIARALALDPDVLFFDEPTSALDPELTKDVLKVIRDLAAENMTMVIVTHEMNFARDVADHIVFMDGGVIVEEGPAEQLINNPQHQRTQAFLAKFEGE